MIEAVGSFSVRFAEIKENNFSGQVLDRWWNVSNETEETVALELSGIVSESVLPFLNLHNNYNKLEKIMDNLKGWQTKTPYFQINKALLYWKLGNQTACAEVLSSISKWPDQVERVRKWVSDHPPT